jgi:hypothetical protein
VDKEGREVKPGEVGEIIVSGPILMTGYWKRPQQTQETIKDGWLHTGDLAKRDEEGFFYIVDREKDMFISGGENIYPAEVEKVYLENPRISDVAVVGVPDEKWGEAVKAVVVLKPGEKASEDEVKEWCKDRLAKFKSPPTWSSGRSCPAPQLASYYGATGTPGKRKSLRLRERICEEVHGQQWKHSMQRAPQVRSEHNGGCPDSHREAAFYHCVPKACPGCNQHPRSIIIIAIVALTAALPILTMTLNGNRS